MDTPRETSSDARLGLLLEGRYRLTTLVARGGMATVYTGLDERLDRTVAVKVMHRSLAEDPDFVARFTREARSAARLSAPEAVAVFDQGRDEATGLAYLVMEYVEGRTLRDLLRQRGALSVPRALSLMEPVLRALAAAHRAGLVHRDVKPENVLLGDDGRIKVADFGLARAVETSSATATTGLLIGTVAYLAPEQVQQGRADTRTDVYAAGVVLWELLTGRPPYDGESPLSVAYRHVHEDIPAPSTLVAVPPELDDLVLRATRRDPALRPPDGAAFLAELALLRTGPAGNPTEVLPAATAAARSATAAAMSRHQPPSAGPWREPAAAVGGGPMQTTAAPGAGGPGFPLEPAAAAMGGPGSRHPLAAPDGPGPPVPAAMAGRRQEPVVSNGDHHDTVVPSSDRHDTVVPNGGRHDTVVPNGGRHDTVVVPRGPSVTAGVPRRRRRRRGRWLALLLAVLAVLGVAAAWYLGSGRYTTAPGVLATPVAEADQKLRGQGFRVRVLPELRFDEQVPAGQVLRQRPEPGRRVARHGTVTLTVSKGADRRVVPAVVGSTQDAARAAIDGAGLRVGDVGSAFSTQPPGVVLGSGPPAGQPLRPDTAVALTISKGPEQLPVPDVTRKAQEPAVGALKAAGFAAGVELVFDDDAPFGRVVAQSPSRGTAPRGSTVTLSVSKGPDLVAVPVVTGLRRADAQATLAALGLKTTVVSIPAGPGVVRSQDPGRGSVRRGSTVRLFVF